MEVIINEQEKEPDYKKIHIQEYIFTVLSGPQNQANDKNLNKFEFRPLGKAIFDEQEKLAKVIKKESVQAKDSGFKISQLVKEHRGIQELEDMEYEQKVREDVRVRVNAMKNEELERAWTQGRKVGQEQFEIKAKKLIHEKSVFLEKLIEEVALNKEKILKDQELKIIELLRVLTKWVILRELKDDGQYLSRLIQKLMGELNQRDHLVVKVNKNYFKNMDDVVEALREKLDILHNCRVEVDHYQNNIGIILESQSGLADGSFETQMTFLDSLFEKVLEN